VIPVVTPEEMVLIDRAAAEPVEVLIGRAGGAVARAALDMLGGAYGRRVIVVVGKGNNGNDGREAARRLRARGVAVTLVDAAGAPEVLPPADLVIDAAYGTGFRGEYNPPLPRDPDTPVLAVDIPSGVSGLTGAIGGNPLSADRTVTFAALKPGLLLEPGASLCGRIDVADIGLDTSTARTHLVEAADIAEWLPTDPPTAHKWQRAVWIIGGSPGMTGAIALAARGALRTGAGYVRLSTPGGDLGQHAPVEAVGVPLPAGRWAEPVLAEQGRFGAIVVGNGLGLDAGHASELRLLAAAAVVPTVIDADGLTLLGRNAASVVQPHTILTPHDGEFARLAGCAPGEDRLDAVRRLAAELGCVVLLKGPLTTVAEPGGDVLLTNTGDSRLATAGTGDVLAGVIGALCARGVPPFEAAAAGAFIHGLAGALGWRHGLVAGDVADHLPEALDRLAGRGS
jgi:NAD(P)H-hydrate epimerase